MRLNTHASAADFGMSSIDVIEIPDLLPPAASTPSFPLPAHNPLYLDKHVNVPPPPNLLSAFAAATAQVTAPASTTPVSPSNVKMIEVVTDSGPKAPMSAAAPAAAAAPAVSQDTEPSASFLDLFRFASAGDKIMVVFAFLLAFLHGACLPAFSYVFGEFMDTTGSVSKDELLDRVSFLAGIMVAIGAFAFVASGLWTALFAYSSQRQGARIRTIYLASIIGKDCAWFDSVTPAEIPTRMNEEISKIQTAIGHQLGTGTMNASMFVLGVILGLVRGWQVALIVCSAMPLIGMSSGALGFFMSQKEKVQMDAYAASGAVAEEVIYSIRTVTAFGGQIKEFARYCSKLSNARAAGVRSGFLLACSLGLVYMFFYWGYAIAFWFGGKLISEDVKNSFTNKVWTGGDVVIVFFSVIMGLFGVGQVFPALDAVRVGRASAGRVYPILRLPSSIEPMLQDTSDIDPTLLPASFPVVDLTPEASAAISSVKSLSLRHVNFCYPARPSVTVLDGVSINLSIGQKIAFVGSSGSGKSTIISLLMRFYDPQSGAVLLNGIDIRTMPVMHLRRVFGYVGQEPVVFGMSVRQNLLYGFPDQSGYCPSQADIESACARAQVLQFINGLPLQFDTLCGSGGSQISGGQKQRIAIARALLRRPQVLLLDEATSALDNESEALVQQTIDSLGDISTISVAHRLSTIRNCDRIFVMNSGRVVEQGNHEELMAIPDGSYAHLVHLQSSMAAAGKDQAPATVTAKGPTAATAKAKASPLVTSQKTPDSTAAVSTSESHDEDEAAAIKKRQEEIGKTYKVPFSRLLTLVDGEKKWFIPGLIGAAMQGSNMPLSGVFMADTLAYFYNPVKSEMEAGVFRYALWFVLLGVGTCIGTVLSSGSWKRIEHVLVMNVRSLCFEKFMHQDIAFFDDPAHSPGKLTGALSTWSLKMSPLAGSTMGFQLQALSAIIIGLSFAFASSWKLSLVMLATIPCMGLGAALNAVVMLGGEFDEKKDVAESQLIASEAVQNIRTLRSCGAQAWVLRNYSAASLGPLARRRTMAMKQGISFGVSQGMLFPCYGLGFWYGTKLMIDDGLPYADMLKAILCVIFAAWGMGEALGFMPDINEAKTAAHDVFELLDAPSGIDPITVPAGAIQDDGDGSISFNDVHFAYPQRPDVPILQGLSFSVKKGQKIALVGPSGGGKSTVIALLERFYDPSKGSIIIGGKHELTKMDVTWWRQQIGYVGQEPVMFDLTLADNVKYGCFSAVAESDLTEVAEASNMDFIRKGSNNSLEWTSPLGPRGGLLSGGQKQRAAIARAQLRKPRLMLFDEATSALDSNSEKLVQAALERSMVGRTSFTIAHRLSTIVDSDVILVIAQGRLVEQGSHAELMQKGGVYYSQFMQGQGAQ